MKGQTKSLGVKPLIQKHTYMLAKINNENSYLIHF